MLSKTIFSIGVIGGVVLEKSRQFFLVGRKVEYNGVNTRCRGRNALNHTVIYVGDVGDSSSCSESVLVVRNRDDL